MRTTTHRPLRYSSGGFFKNNWLDLLKVAGGTALIATGAGAGAGAGLVAGGATGMLSNKFGSDTPEFTQPDNSWAINNRHHKINTMRAPYTIYQTGGRISMMRPEPQGVSNAPGGQLEQEASNIHRAQGQTHEQGGIQLPGGEIEHNELLVDSPFTGDTQVHSDELGYADATKQLAQQKEQLEGQLQQKIQKIQTLQQEQQRISSDNVDKDKLERNKAKRESEKIAQYMNREEQELMTLQHQIFAIDQQIEQLFMQQEQEAAMMGMRDEEGMPVEGDEQPMFETGGSLEFADFVPFISNIANVGFNRKLAGQPVPEVGRQSTPTVDANVDINPQLQNIAGSRVASEEMARQLPGQVGRGFMGQVRTDSLRAEDEVRAGARNMETQIRADNARMAAGIEGANLDREFRTRTMEFERDTAAITRDSANIANLESKLTQRINQDRMLDFQTLQLGINLSAFEKTSIPTEMLNTIAKGGYLNTEQLIQAARAANVSDADLAKLLEELNNQ